MFKWEKVGLVFNLKNHQKQDWMNEFAQAPSVIEYEDFIRVFFNCRPKPDENGYYVSYSAFVDFDRSDLTRVLNLSKKPLIELGNYGEFDEFGTYPISVIRVKDKLHAYYGGWTRCESVPFNVAIGHVISHDEGLSFQKIHKGPVLSYSMNEPFILSGPKIRKFHDKFYLFYISGSKWIEFENKPEPVYKIRMATSNDGINWEKHDKNLINDVLGTEEAQASPDVIFYKGLYHMFFCYRKAIDYRHNKENSYRIGYAYSFDLINWTRDDKKSGIDVSDEGWDSSMVAYPHVFELDGELYMYYLGNEVGKEGFGLAKLKYYSDLKEDIE